MTLSTQISRNGRVVIISIDGRFDWRGYRALACDLKQASQTQTKYVIDMSETEHFNDAGLSILLMLRQRLGESRIDAVRCGPKTRDTISNFGFAEIVKMN